MKIRSLLAVASVLVAGAFADTNVFSLVRTNSVVPVPALTLTTVDGKQLKLADCRDQTLLVVFWATWDTYCQEQLPALIELQRTYRTNEFTVLGLAIDNRGPEHVKAFAATHNINFPVVIADYDTIQAFGGLTAIPTLIVVAPNRLLMQRRECVTEKSVLETDIKAVLRK